MSYSSNTDALHHTLENIQVFKIYIILIFTLVLDLIYIIFCFSFSNCNGFIMIFS